MSEPKPERVDDERFVKALSDVLRDDPGLHPRQAMEQARRRLRQTPPPGGHKTGGFK
jgi:hypothetical protein